MCGFKMESWNGTAYETVGKLVSVVGSGAHMDSASRTTNLMFYVNRSGSEKLAATFTPSGAVFGDTAPSTDLPIAAGRSDGPAGAAFIYGSATFSMGTDGTHLCLASGGFLNSGGIFFRGNSSREVAIGPLANETIYDYGTINLTGMATSKPIVAIYSATAPSSSYWALTVGQWMNVYGGILLDGSVSFRNGTFNGVTGNPLTVQVNSVNSLIVDTDTTAGGTRLQIYDADTSSLKRVKVGAAGTGPGGSGRALYFD